MRRILTLLILVLFPAGYHTLKGVDPAGLSVSDTERLYYDMELEGIVEYTAFEQAIDGAARVDAGRRDVITLIDFTKPSTEKRLYVLDIEERRVLFSSVVAHGRNSGDKYATSFSNKDGSYKSSLGFYITGETYQGENGYSLRLNGIEKGINDHALQRAIVIHGASYCNPSFIASAGRLGRSRGCPALPESVNAEIIDAIKGGSLLYIYAADRNYLSQSRVLAKPSDIAML